MPSLCSLVVAFASVVCPFVSPSTSGSRPGRESSPSHSVSRSHKFKVPSSRDPREVVGNRYQPEIDGRVST